MSSTRPRPTGSVPTSRPSARRPRHRFGCAQLWRRWARGVPERIRLQGGIAHPWLDKFISSGGNRHCIWGGRPRREGMPAFPARRPAPSFPTTARASEAFESISGRKGWYALWTARALGVPSVDAPRYVQSAPGRPHHRRRVALGSSRRQVPSMEHPRVAHSRPPHNRSQPCQPAVWCVLHGVPSAFRGGWAVGRCSVHACDLPRQLQPHHARVRLLLRHLILAGL